MNLRRLSLLFVASFAVANQALALSAEEYRSRKTLVPVSPGNRRSEQPALPPEVKKKFQDPVAGGPSAVLEARYQKVMRVLRGDSRLLADVREVARQYELDPVFILGAIVGEHTYNVDVKDSVQTYAIKATEWAGAWALRFRRGGVDLADVIEREEFDVCKRSKNEYDKWDCVAEVWNKQFQGRVIEQTTYPNAPLRTAFFNPIGVGFTYGLGQLEPLRALMLTDIVHERGGLPLLDVGNPREIYETILRPRTAIHYIAANLRKGIDLYRDIAGFDISRNPGLAGTLYNLGREKMRARSLYQKNIESLSRGGPIEWPEENYYGWFINSKISDLRALAQ